MRGLKRLAIHDFDNCWTNTNKTWRIGILGGINHFHTTFNVPPEVVREEIMKAEGQHRFCDFGGLCHAFKERNVFKLPKDQEERYLMETTLRIVRSEYFERQRRDTVFYDGIPETIGAIHEAGSAQVVYTDGEAPTMMRRLWFMAKNSGIDPLELLDRVDMFFAMPSIEPDRHLIWDLDTEFIHKMKQKLVLFQDGKRKANPQRVLDIMEGFGVSADETMMMGDSDKDAASCFPVDVDFAWMKLGADIDEETVAALTSYASPNYTYGLKAIEPKVLAAAKGKEFVTIDQSPLDLFSHFEFGPARSSYRHNHAKDQSQILLSSMETDQFPSLLPEEYLLYGTPTHRPKDFLSRAVEALAGMAGPEKPDQTLLPQPV